MGCWLWVGWWGSRKLRRRRDVCLVRVLAPSPSLPRYTAAKRFGLEGAESLIPGMKALIDRAADLGVQNIVIGMPHRGARKDHAGRGACGP